MGRKPHTGVRARRDELIERYEAGEASTALAAELGVSTAAVLGCLKRAGVQIRPKAAVVSADDARVMRDRYEAGKSLDAIGADFGLSRHVVKRGIVATFPDFTMRRSGGFAVAVQSGPDNHQWKGGKHLSREGYVLRWIPSDHPRAGMLRTGSHYIREHRLVMADSLGRDLDRTETVHHINGDRTDNRLENLQLRSAAHGPGVNLRCRDCGSHNIEARAI